VFSQELEELVSPVDAKISSQAQWMPRGHQQRREARLETFGPQWMADSCDWSRVTKWWLRQAKGANTPNWDVVCPATINGVDGLILVEAKANVRELSSARKMLKASATKASRENHEGIKAAIEEAQAALASTVPGVKISRDHHYQLSNRIAFAWKLASLRIPTVLVYLGFLRSPDFASDTFTSDQHWRDVFSQRAGTVWPGRHGDKPVATANAPFWVLIRSMNAEPRDQPAMRRA